MLLLAGVAYWVVNSLAPNTQHQPAAISVDSCGYSDMVLVMGENIIRNI